MTKPSVININPKLSNTIRQQTPFTFGQNGFGADIASIRAPARRDRLLRPVFAELATEYKLLGPLECERFALYRLFTNEKKINNFICFKVKLRANKGAYFVQRWQIVYREFKDNKINME